MVYLSVPVCSLKPKRPGLLPSGQASAPPRYCRSPRPEQAFCCSIGTVPMAEKPRGFRAPPSPSSASAKVPAFLLSKPMNAPASLLAAPPQNQSLPTAHRAATRTPSLAREQGPQQAAPTPSTVQTMLGRQHGPTGDRRLTNPLPTRPPATANRLLKVSANARRDTTLPRHRTDIGPAAAAISRGGGGLSSAERAAAPR